MDRYVDFSTPIHTFSTPIQQQFHSFFQNVKKYRELRGDKSPKNPDPVVSVCDSESVCVVWVFV